MTHALRPEASALSAMHLRDAQAADAAAVLALNQRFVQVLSPLDAPQLARLAAQAALYRVVERCGEVQAFLLALREGADYASANYRWFAARYPRFLYVDRVVVAADAQGQGVGRMLYRDAIARGLGTGAPLLVCEYDLEPPNPASAAFHAAMGLVEVGRQHLPGGKQVSMQALTLVPDP